MTDGEGTGPSAEEATIEAPEEEEVQPQRHLATPPTPTQADMAEHRDNGHVQYRNWCSDCVEGFGREWPHSTGTVRGIPLISCAYLYLNQRGVFSRNELSEEE